MVFVSHEQAFGQNSDIQYCAQLSLPAVLHMLSEISTKKSDLLLICSSSYPRVCLLQDSIPPPFHKMADEKSNAAEAEVRRKVSLSIFPLFFS